MTLHIAIFPEIYNGEVVDAQSQPISFAEKVQSVYEQVFLQYEDQLRAEGQKLDLLAPETSPAGYPSIKAILVNEEGEQEIVFDFDLYALLLESYILDGWEGGIARLQSALAEKATDDMVKQFDYKPSGVREDPGRIWVVARLFFEFTRNLVAILIHESLVAIEYKAAQIVESRLTKALERIAEARAGKLMGRLVNGRFELNRRKVAQQLYEDMSTLSMWMGFLEKGLQDLQDMRLNFQGRSREQPHGMEAAEGRSGTTDPDRAAEDIKLAEKVLLHAQNGASAATKVAHETSPFALLALAYLGEKYTMAEMEAAIDQALTKSESKCKELQEAINPDTSRIAAKWPRPLFDDPATPDQITKIREWHGPKLGLAAATAAEVLSQMGSDAGWLPLAHEEVLHTLVSEGGIDKESFEYPVYFHYVSAWTEAADKARETTEAVTDIMSNISKGLAATSLLTRVFPQLLPVSGGTKLASYSINALFLAYSVFSHLKDLSALDQAIQLELIGTDALGAESAAKIADLEKTKDSVSDEFTKQMLTMLIEITINRRAAAAPSASLSKLVRVRDYMLDLETLAAPTENGGR